MARRGTKSKSIVLSDEERAALDALTRKRTIGHAIGVRARIILLSGDGLAPVEIAERLGCTKANVGKWKLRWRRLGLDGLSDAPRSGAPRTVSDERVEEIVRLTLESRPDGATHWSTRSMARNVGLSQSAVSRIWRAFGLQPHRAETFQLSTDPFFVEKVRDVVGLYIDPPANALVLSVDEKSQIQALNRTQPLLPLRPGQIERRTPEYRRNGITTLFAALNVASGKVIGKTYSRHRALEFVRFLRHVDRNEERIGRGLTNAAKRRNATGPATDPLVG